LRDHINLW